MWKWLERNKGVGREELGRLEDRLSRLEEVLKDQQSLFVEWATMKRQLTRLAGQITKTAALDGLIAPRQSQENAPPRELTRDEIARMNV